MTLAFAPICIEKSNFVAINDDVIVESMEFDERITGSGLILLNDNGTGLGIRPRWGKVYAVGDKQFCVKPGDWILVSHGRWFRGLDIEDEDGVRTIRKIDPNDILLVSDERPFDETMSQAVHVARAT